MTHLHKETFTEVLEIPDHEKRTTSNLFKKNREHLVDELGKGCWVCGSKEDLEVHHYLVEWSLFNDCDCAKLTELSKVFDAYGFGKLMETEIDNPDDIRNLMVLCKHHHREPNNGVHEVTFPTWIAQKIAKDGVDLTPDNLTNK